MKECETIDIKHNYYFEQGKIVSENFLGQMDSKRMGVDGQSSGLTF